MKNVFLAMAVILAGLTAFCDEEGRSGVVAFDPTKAARTTDGGISLVGPSNRSATKNAQTTDGLLESLADDDVFLEVDGRDSLKWGLIKAQLDANEVPVPGSEEWDQDSQNAARAMIFQTRFKKLVSSYLQYAVFAAAARRAGITIDESEYATEREKSRKFFAGQGAAGAKCLKLMDEPESYYEHNLTNALLWRAYAEKVVRPTIVVSDEDVAMRVKSQSEINDQIEATNAFHRALMNDILAKVRPADGAEAMDFGEAAAKWSECDTADTKGVFMDEDDEGNQTPAHLTEGDVREELEAAYAKMKVGEISDIVETPYSWHILKLLARHEETDEDEASVELAHIMIDKVGLRPELTPDQARKRLSNAMMKYEMAKQFADLVKTIPITCKIPLFDTEANGARSPKIQIKRLK